MARDHPWRNTMKSSVAAKQLAFRMTSYNGFATRRAAPTGGPAVILAAG
jgi:hypothetical protein